MKGKNKTFKLISTIVGWATLGISVILAILFYIGLANDQTISSKVLHFIVVFVKKHIDTVNLLMYWTIIMVILAIVIAFLIGPILSIITNPKNLAKSLISIGVLVVVVLLAYSFSSGDISTINLNYTIDPEKLKKQLVFTETGLTTFYIMLGLTFVATLVAELKGLFKL